MRTVTTGVTAHPGPTGANDFVAVNEVRNFAPGETTKQVAVTAGTTTTAIFTISLFGPTYQDVTVNYSTTNITTRSSSSSLLGKAHVSPR